MEIVLANVVLAALIEPSKPPGSFILHRPGVNTWDTKGADFAAKVRLEMFCTFTFEGAASGDRAIHFWHTDENGEIIQRLNNADVLKITQRHQSFARALTWTLPLRIGYSRLCIVVDDSPRAITGLHVFRGTGESLGAPRIANTPLPLD